MPNKKRHRGRIIIIICSNNTRRAQRDRRETTDDYECRTEWSHNDRRTVTKNVKKRKKTPEKFSNFTRRVFKVLPPPPHTFGPRTVTRRVNNTSGVLRISGRGETDTHLSRGHKLEGVFRISQNGTSH